MAVFVRGLVGLSSEEDHFMLKEDLGGCFFQRLEDLLELTQDWPIDEVQALEIYAATIRKFSDYAEIRFPEVLWGSEDPEIRSQLAGIEVKILAEIDAIVSVQADEKIYQIHWGYPLKLTNQEAARGLR